MTSKSVNKRISIDLSVLIHDLEAAYWLAKKKRISLIKISKFIANNVDKEKLRENVLNKI